MAEQEKMNENPPVNSKFMLTSVFLVVAVVLIGGAFYFLKGGKSTSMSDDAMVQSVSDNTNSMSETPVETIDADAMDEGSMEPDNSMSTEAEMTVEVEGGNYYFKPNEIRVKKGQPVKIILNSVEGFHNFVIDEFNVKTDITPGGQKAEVTFTPDKAGTFEFYCSVGNHRAMGMWGNLIVEE